MPMPRITQPTEAPYEILILIGPVVSEDLQTFQHLDDSALDVSAPT